MLRTALFGLALTATLASATAQTSPARKPTTSRARSAAPATRPQPTPSKPASDGQGEYVAPDMSGAPNDRVTTDYSNRPLKKPAANTSTLSAQPKPAAPAQKQ